MVLAIALLPAPARASCGSSECPLDAHGADATTRHPDGPGSLSRARLSIDIAYQYIDQDQPRVGSHRATVGELVSREDEVRTINRMTTLTVRGVLSEQWSLTASMPFVDRFHSHIVNEVGGGSQRQEFNYHGMGDLSVLGHWMPWGADHGGPTSLTLQAGIKLPGAATRQLLERGGLEIRALPDSLRPHRH